jgi:hypothetical protein
VKELVLQLVADGIVNQEKIGVGTYFWAFPSQASQTVRALKVVVLMSFAVAHQAGGP